ncbi:protein takeout isoform X2 [Stomoxys calcitrans]|uniref:Uncharacterized protein n=1 Tax=Stomoxys calcitrans TaxID=35570 RepID=A0A1I8Q5I3_STOCA|nr:protein takeout isoform X2 [Stomoxys calcitrans]
MIPKVIFILLILVAAAQGDFPDDPKPCKYGDAECIGKLFEYFVREKHKGDESIGLTSIDPLPVKKIPITVGSDSPVNIDLVVFNGKVEGVSTLKFVKMKGFGKDIAVNHEIVSQSDSLIFTGPYNLTGKVLLLPISGSDVCNITLCVVVKFNNLYNDKELSDNMNKLLNENVKELYAEISHLIDKGYAAIVRKVVTKVFATYPYEKFFMN